MIAKTEALACLLYWSDDGTTISCEPNFILSIDDFHRPPEYFIS